MTLDCNNPLRESLSTNHSGDFGTAKSWSPNDFLGGVKKLRPVQNHDKWHLSCFFGIYRFGVLGVRCCDPSSFFLTPKVPKWPWPFCVSKLVHTEALASLAAIRQGFHLQHPQPAWNHWRTWLMARFVPLSAPARGWKWNTVNGKGFSMTRIENIHYD